MISEIGSFPNLNIWRAKAANGCAALSKRFYLQLENLSDYKKTLTILPSHVVALLLLTCENTCIKSQEVGGRVAHLLIKLSSLHLCGPFLKSCAHPSRSSAASLLEKKKKKKREHTRAARM
jgi:hypothetical protein